jgi:hypothetical protein
MKTVWAFCLAFLLFLIVQGHAQESHEPAKIQYLIDSVQTLTGGKFIRNGKVYDAGAAANHLRLKLKVAGKRVKTAEDFIRICASKSSETGKPYRIQMVDGTTVDAEVFFRSKLKDFPGKTTP